MRFSLCLLGLVPADINKGYFSNTILCRIDHRLNSISLKWVTFDKSIFSRDVTGEKAASGLEPSSELETTGTLKISYREDRTNDNSWELLITPGIGERDIILSFAWKQSLLCSTYALPVYKVTQHGQHHLNNKDNDFGVNGFTETLNVKDVISKPPSPDCRVQKVDWAILLSYSANKCLAEWQQPPKCKRVTNDEYFSFFLN